MLLHIANDFCGSKVYRNLFKSLHNQGLGQIVYTAVRKNVALPVDLPGFLSVKYSPILKPYMRIVFHSKRRAIYKDLLQKVELDKIRLVHAHTWYSDGAIALQLFKDYGIPYVVTIRNTDINLFYRYLIHLRSLGAEILANAKHIVFISSAHENRLSDVITHNISSPHSLIPNGVDSFWLDNITKQHFFSGDTFNLTYVGCFDPGKNVPRLIKALLELNEDSNSIKFHLTLVGDRGSDTKQIMEAISSHPHEIEWKGRINDKNKLKQEYNNCDAFVMPSLAETFGLVYVEAMTQGLPVLYSKGEGIDGFFDEKYGVRCNPRSVKDIKRCLRYLRDNYNNFKIDSNRLKQQFDWDNIAVLYKSDIYEL